MQQARSNKSDDYLGELHNSDNWEFYNEGNNNVILRFKGSNL